MKKTFFVVVLILSLIGCDVKTGSSASMPDIAIYPGSKIIMNGENQGVKSAVVEVTDDKQKVIAFYAKELGVTPDPSGAGNLKGSKGGHEISVIVTDAGQGKVSTSITQPK
jgi:hypothetical protein